MCGRYRLTRRRLIELENNYGVDDVDIWERQFNIPPREMAPIVFERNGQRHLTSGLWTLLPPWAKNLEYANEVSTFNAKAETIAEKPTFREALLNRRCVVPAAAFYEWVGPSENGNRCTSLGTTGTLCLWQGFTAIGNRRAQETANPYLHSRDR